MLHGYKFRNGQMPINGHLFKNIKYKCQLIDTITFLLITWNKKTLQKCHWSYPSIIIGTRCSSQRRELLYCIMNDWHPCLAYLSTHELRKWRMDQGWSNRPHIWKETPNDRGNYTLPLKEHYLLPSLVFKNPLLFIYAHTTQVIAITLFLQDSRFLPTNKSTMNLKEQRNA